ncbi:TolC family protein [uncultured Helicobacter sp.]|uniref:TolC family protein n=1 Tax=uncultured Helicobacter sp. TaxID=175537 RepID=UPI002632185D|nr:TolC family protein [uncultured Helicobacter sp.]
MQNNYEIQIALLRDSIAKDSLNLAKKSYIGDLTISGSYMYRVSKPDMFALSLSIPLPIYGKERQLVKQGSYENMLSQSGIAEMQNTIKHTAFNLQAKLTNLQENLKLIEDTLLPSNQKISNLYKHHSTSQSSAFLEFYNAMNDEIDTHILRLEMLAQMYIAYWNLRSLKGEI